MGGIECTKGDTGFRGERGEHTRRIRRRAERVVELPADGCLREPVDVSSGLLRFSQSPLISQLYGCLAAHGLSCRRGCA